MSGLTDGNFLASVLRNGELSIGARILYWELTQWVDEDLNVCFPTQRKLAEHLNVSRNSVIRWLQELRDKRFIEDVPQRYGNAYVIRTCASQIRCATPQCAIEGH